MKAYEGTKAEMLVRTEGVSGRSPVPVSLRTEPVPEASEHVAHRKRRKAQQDAAYRSANREKINIQRRKRNSEWMKQWRLENLELARLRGREQSAKHPGENARRARKSYHLNKPKRMLAIKAWQDANPQKVIEYSRKARKRNIESLADTYVRSKLNRGRIDKGAEWPTSLVNLKRAALKLKRLCRKLQTTTN